MEGSLPIGRVLALNPNDLLLLLPWLDDIWRSFWLDWSSGDMGYGPDWFYLIWALFLLFSLLGWLRRPTHGAPWVLTFLVVSVVVLAISALYFAVKALTVKEAGFLVPEGRWWPAGHAWHCLAGSCRFLALVLSSPLRDKAVLVAAIVPALSTILLLFLHLPALYPQARPLPVVVGGEQNDGLIFNDELALSAADVESMTAGRPAEISLTWQALKDIDKDYIVGVQLLVLDPHGWQKLEEQYTYPGNGLTPTKGWRAGDRYGDFLILIPGGELNGPTQAAVAISLSSDGEKIQAMHDGAPLDPPHLLTTIVRPQTPLTISTPLVDPLDFAGLFTLEGAETRREEDDLLLTLWWHAAQPPTEDYQVFVHLLDKNGQLLAQADGQPNHGLSPTHIWQQGDVIRDTRRLPSFAAQAVMLRIGVYSLITGERLPVSQGDHQLPERSFGMTLAP